MAQIINPVRSFGESLGTGLSQGLQQLAQFKLSQLANQQEQERYGQLYQSLYGDGQQGMQPMVGQQHPLLAALMRNLQGSSQGQQAGNALEHLQSLLSGGNQANAIQQQKQMIPKAPAQLSKEQFKELVKGRQDAQKLAAKDKMEIAKEQRAINKEKLPFLKEIRGEAKAAGSAIHRLKRMEDLVDKGKLANPTFASVLKSLKHGIWGLGVDLTGLLNADSQEFDKLTNDFVTDVQKATGSGRITNELLKTFISRVPNLSQSDAGKKRVINNLSLLSRMAQEREKALNKIVRQNKGNIPFNVEEQIEQLAGPQLDKLSAEFEQKNEDLRDYDSLANRVKRDREYWKSFLK